MLLQGVFLVRQLWLQVRSNPIFVAFSGFFVGAIGNSLDDQLRGGHVDLSQAGLHKLLIASGVSALIAVIHLYRPAPNQPASQPAQPTASGSVKE